MTEADHPDPSDHPVREPAGTDPAPPVADGAAPPGIRRRAADALARAQHLADQAREAFAPVDIGFTAIDRDSRIGGFLLAGAIAFRLFVYLLPLYLLLLVGAGAAVSFDPKSPTELAGSAGLSTYLASMIGDAAETSHRSLWILAPVTLWALFSAGRSVHKALAASHANAWGIPIPKGAKPLEVGAAVFGFALVILAGVIGFRNLHDGLLAPLGAVVAGTFYGVVWLQASRMLPRAAGASTLALVPGAILVAVGSQALYLFNVLYLNQKIQSASEAYGALGIAASLLLWLYLLGRLMVAAPVLNATLWERGHPSGTGEPDQQV